MKPRSQKSKAIRCLLLGFSIAAATIATAEHISLITLAGIDASGVDNHSRGVAHPEQNTQAKGR